MYFFRLFQTDVLLIFLGSFWKEKIIAWSRVCPGDSYTCIIIALYVFWYKLTHWGRDKMGDIFKCIFSNENVWILMKIALKFVPKGPINDIPALVRLLTHVCVTRPQWVKTENGVGTLKSVWSFSRWNFFVQTVSIQSLKHAGLRATANKTHVKPVNLLSIMMFDISKLQPKFILGLAKVFMVSVYQGCIYTYTVRVSVSESVSETLTELCLHYIRGSDPRQWPFLVACGSDHVNRQLWACASHNLGRTRKSESEEIATCSDELGHGRTRQKSQTRTRISVNTKHQFTCFDCVRARTRMLGPRSRM